MPTIEITEATFARLQTFATPLVDSAETALSKVLDLAETSRGPGPTGAPTRASSGAAPNLTHTTVTSASIDGRALPPALRNWNALMLEVIERAADRLPAGQEIADFVVVNYVKGQKEDNGYRFLKSVGLSVQGQNSNNAWKAVQHLAKSTGLKVDVSFCWSSDPKAFRPGEAGKVSI